MTCSVLVDNTPAQDARLISEHGLSLYIEVGGKHILLDTGLTGAAFDNAALMGIDIAAVDLLVLSHGHNDHTGGLQRFFALNSRATVYGSEYINRYTYWSNRRGIRDLSPDKEVLNRYGNRFCWLTADTALAPDIYAVFCPHTPAPCPSGNSFLSVTCAGVTRAYDATDELALAVDTRNGRVVFSPCSHKGVLNILLAVQRIFPVQPITAFIGGLHLLNEMADKDHAAQLATRLAADYPDLHLYTGHCTESTACTMLSAALDSRFHTLQTGLSFSL